ncbi:MAG: PDZ domain-containing protein [Bacteroidota bacterium]
MQKRPSIALVVLFLLLVANSTISVAQDTPEETLIFQRLTISLIDEDQSVERIQLYEMEVEQFDVAQFLQDHIDQADIQLRGTTMSTGVVNKYRFDRKDWIEDPNCPHFCEEIEKIEKIPFLGVATNPTEAFEGIVVNKVLRTSIAQEAGIQKGDLITHLEGEEIRSGCDLRTLVSTYAIGDPLKVNLIRGGQRKAVEVTLGFRLIKSITWVNCCSPNRVVIENSNQRTPINQELTLFPNPSEGLAQMQYRSDQIGPLQLSITDVSGKVLFYRDIPDFSGWHQEYLDITGAAEGIYFLHVTQADHTATKKMVVHKTY